MIVADANLWIYLLIDSDKQQVREQDADWRTVALCRDECFNVFCDFSLFVIVYPPRFSECPCAVFLKSFDLSATGQSVNRLMKDVDIFHLNTLSRLL